jgi:hypothetical protein
VNPIYLPEVFSTYLPMFEIHVVNHNLWISSPNLSLSLSLPLHLLPAVTATHRGRADPHDGACCCPGTLASMVVRAPVPLAVASHGCRAGSSSGCPGSSPAALRAGARLAPRDFASEAPRLAAPLPPPTTVEGRRKGKKMLIFFSEKCCNISRKC